MPELSIVVPVFNEVESVETLCAQVDAALAKAGRTHELILVDDGSTDGTWEKLKGLAQKYPYLRALRFRGNFGQTAAMSAGFHAARGEVVITLDADLQNDPADIPLLLAKLAEGFDVVSGWRKHRQDPFLNRRLPSTLANGFISRITGVPLHDYGCTLKAYKRDVIRDVHLYGEMHRFIPALCAWVGATVGEVAVNHRARQFGTSKYGISRTFRVVLDLITVKFLLRYSTRPIQIFGRIGFSFAGLALLMLAAMLADRIFGFVDPYLLKRPFWVITPLMFLGFALQIVCVGLLAEIQIRTWHESQNKPIYVVKESLPAAQ